MPTRDEIQSVIKWLDFEIEKAEKVLNERTLTEMPFVAYVNRRNVLYNAVSLIRYLAEREGIIDADTQAD